jgi:hypothetical protein
VRRRVGMRQIPPSTAIARSARTPPTHNARSSTVQRRRPLGALDHPIAPECLRRSQTSCRSPRSRRGALRISCAVSANSRAFVLRTAR